MDKEKVKRDWTAIVAAMPAVKRLIEEKRGLYGPAHVNECWRRGVLNGEPEFFYAREGGVAIGTPWGDPLYFEGVHVPQGAALLMMREPKPGTPPPPYALRLVGVPLDEIVGKKS
jgi:hypothetical protein